MIPTVTVCVATYRRPTLLDTLLAAIAGQEGAPPFEVVAVDNDPSGSAAPVLRSWAERAPRLQLRREQEPRQNIARARNRAVALARGSWLAFVDDDEKPGPDWLAALHRMALCSGADGVLGPVIPRFAPRAPAWVARGDFFQRPRHPTGARVPRAELRTGNLLVKGDLLRAAGRGPFDVRFGLSGGEDSDLLGHLSDRGARFVWCDEAPVHEWIPAERARAAYLLRAAFAAGNVHARQELAAAGDRAALSLLLSAAGAAGVGSLLAATTFPLGLEVAVRWARRALAGAGKIAALTGHEFERYRGR